MTLYPHNVDAMVLSELWRRPTINGFSTFNPPGWNFADAKASDYPARVSEYADRFNLGPGCMLDMNAAEKWGPIGEGA
jgi:hypothetical protein